MPAGLHLRLTLPVFFFPPTLQSSQVAAGLAELQSNGLSVAEARVALAGVDHPKVFIWGRMEVRFSLHFKGVWKHRRAGVNCSFSWKLVHPSPHGVNKSLQKHGVNKSLLWPVSPHIQVENHTMFQRQDQDL
eukprot:1158986-Pelagomonas_calceolata.AAC.2